MANLRLPIIVASAVSVAACGVLSPEELDELDASFACLERASAVFPVLDQMSDVADEKPAESSDNFRTDAAGGFVLTSKFRGKDRPLPEEFECRGNLTGRTIAFIQLNGVTKRPNPTEIWKY